MQKDIHFYTTYALARKAGVSKEDSLHIAWADQFTDDCTEAGLYGIQTQSRILGNWTDKQIQHTVLVPFHFVPGDYTWVVRPFSKRIREITAQALNNPFQLGIALHTLQDTFSHQGFTGWQEKENACYPFWYLQSTIPNIGHAEMGLLPDITNAKWTDPRTGKTIQNNARALLCAEWTYKFLMGGGDVELTIWADLAISLAQIFREKNYDNRKSALRRLAGEDDSFRYSALGHKWIGDFVSAARKHLSLVMDSIKDLSCDD